MATVYKELTIDDVEGMVSLFTELENEAAPVSFSRGIDRARAMEWIGDSDVYLFGAACDGRLVGIFRATRNPDHNKRHSCYLTAAVSRSTRNRGVATELTDYALGRLGKAGLTIARAKVYSDNTASLTVLLKCGFTISGCIHKHEYRSETKSFVDDIILHRELSST